MKFARTELSRHLERIHVGGEVEEAVIRPDLSVSAATTDGLMVVDVPPLDADTQFDEPVGVDDLGHIIKSLSLGQDPEVEIRLDERRLVIDAGEVGRGWFLTGDPPTIGTRIQDEARDALLGEIEENEGRPIGTAVVSGVAEWKNLLDAQEVHVECGPDGSTFRVGLDTNHYGEVDAPGLMTDGDEYTLIFPAGMLVNVFDLVPDPDEATLTLTGDDSNIGIEFDDHTYILSPMSPSQ